MEKTLYGGLKVGDQFTDPKKSEKKFMKFIDCQGNVKAIELPDSAVPGQIHEYSPETSVVKL